MQVEKRWVLKNGVKFVGVDSHSGGYPYDTNFWDARKFHTESDALQYKRHNDEWELYSVDEVGLKFCQTQDSFEMELATLKKKYGK